jgi:SAM-dependent methyltransferase
LINREIKWVASLNKKNHANLVELQKRMKQYYSDNSNYYSDISFTKNIWNNKDALIQHDIVNECRDKSNILEIGCGQAFILGTGMIKPRQYTGTDYSYDLIEKNKRVHPESKFLTLEEPNLLPFPDESFDLVFSHFVIEHTVFPNLFLDECARVLNPKGTLIITAPNFLGRLGISSQKVGFSKGTGREKLKDRRYLDMIVTAFDNKIRIPAVIILYRFLASLEPRFFINLNPTCFEYEFSPDVDAVYLTYKKEIKAYLNNNIHWLELNTQLKRFVSKNNLIYIKGLKRF